MIDRIYTFLWAVWFWLFIIFAFIVMLLLQFTRLIISPKSYKTLLTRLIRFWGRTMIKATFSTVDASGLENIPAGGSLVLVSNHQGYMDIPLLLGWLDRTVGFVAKQELKKIPVLSQWMQIINSVFIDRSNARSAIRSFEAAAQSIKNGYPIVIFPEGTRSRGDEMGVFHSGSLKLAEMANAVIVPVAISGTWHLFEEHGLMRKYKLKIAFLPPISPEDAVYHNRDELANYIKTEIKSSNQT